jgi:hypothetical protein
MLLDDEIRQDAEATKTSTFIKVTIALLVLATLKGIRPLIRPNCIHVIESALSA